MTTPTNQRGPLADGVVPDPPFTPSPQLTSALQQVLTDLIVLHLQAKHAHWNVAGPNFRGVHRQLDGIVDAARDFSDTVAERMRALGAVPDGRGDFIVSSTRLSALPPGEHSTHHIVDLMGDRLHIVANTARRARIDVEREDPPSIDILHAIILETEKAAWMLTSENHRS